MARVATREERINFEMQENFRLNKSSLEQSRGYCEALVDGMIAVEKATPKLMTKKEALEKIDYMGLLDALEVLGLIKFKPEPKQETLYQSILDDGSMLRLERWPEGLVLWCGGVIQWKQWA